MKRYYTSEQLCDLDVKTSVNKIGEVVNLSQVLNSMYWDKYHHGATHKELHELYCDIATLDVLSNLCIDQAKKEFSINLVNELELIRNKYKDELTTEDNKHILPAFFGHLAKEKGYYDPDHKAYVQHDTSMDYLQTIVRRFKTKNIIPEPTSRIVDLFDMSKYRTNAVNHKQVSHIMKYVKWYSTEISNIYKPTDHISVKPEFTVDDDMSNYEKKQLLTEQLIEKLNDYRIGYHTMIFIVKHLEKKDYYRYRNILLPILFTACRKSFIDAVIDSSDDIDVLVEGGNDIKLYDFSYFLIKNSEFRSKN